MKGEWEGLGKGWGSSKASNRYSGNEWVRETMEACGQRQWGRDGWGHKLTSAAQGVHLEGFGYGCPLAPPDPIPFTRLPPPASLWDPSCQYHMSILPGASREPLAHPHPHCCLILSYQSIADP